MTIAQLCNFATASYTRPGQRLALAGATPAGWGCGPGNGAAGWGDQSDGSELTYGPWLDVWTSALKLWLIHFTGLLKLR